jgi:hypothetical protein
MGAEDTGRLCGGVCCRSALRGSCGRWRERAIPEGSGGHGAFVARLDWTGGRCVAGAAAARARSGAPWLVTLGERWVTRLGIVSGRRNWCCLSKSAGL